MKPMPTPDVALNKFFSDNDIFAAVFNGYFFDQKEVIIPDKLSIVDSVSMETVEEKNKRNFSKFIKLLKIRDLIRGTETNCCYNIMLGIEDQDKVHYAMSVRKMLNDALTYAHEISAMADFEDKSSWSVDELLSGISKGTKITPVITVVIYTGEKPWDGARSLHEMMDIDPVAKPFVPDYPLYVLDLGHDKGLKFPNQELEDLRNMLIAIYSNTADTSQMEISNKIIALAGILTGDVALYRSAQKKKGGKRAMWKALQERDERIRKEYEEKFEEYEEKFEERDKVINDLNTTIASKDEEIAMLKARLISAGIS